jgi:hypothetical protein
MKLKGLKFFIYQQKGTENLEVSMLLNGGQSFGQGDILQLDADSSYKAVYYSDESDEDLQFSL